MSETLPESRLARNPTLGSVVMDWPVPGGGTARLEAVPVYCANCGAPRGYVPKDTTAWAFYLCDDCYRTHGAVAGAMAMPDEAFWAAVHDEMARRFGKVLTDAELAVAAEAGELGKPLELLARESPYPGGKP